MELDEGTYGSPRWTYEILDCAMPMTFDTYSNCAHQCLYCFSFFQRAIGPSADDYLHHKVKAVNVDRVKRMFSDPDQYGGQFKNYIKRRMTLQWGGLSDGFDYYERKFRKSLELLKFFCDMDYPLSISTKGVWFLDDPEYIEVLKGRKNVHFKYSIITSIEDHVKALEPGVPPAAARFEAMYKLNKLGIGATTLRYRPFVLGTSDLCIDDMMKRGQDAGCYSVTTEFLTWESRASKTSKSRLDAMSKTLGYDVWDFYIKNSSRASGLLRLNYDLKRPYILKMKESAEKHGLKFFVSDAHHKEESYHAGCCGLPESGPLSNVNHGQYAHAILIAKDKGFVRWSDISEEARSLLQDIPVIAAEGFPSDTALRMQRQYQSMYDYMHDIWNNPKGWQSPARYFGGALVPSAPDDNGDIVYLYNKPFIELNTRVETVNELAKHLRMTGVDNANRFDEMTADGKDFGHIGYPVYVFSRGRHAIATTMKLLDQNRINYHLVVPHDEWHIYSEAYPHAEINVMPRETTGIRAARQLVLERAREDGYPYVWMLDDDISSTEGNLRSLLSGGERWVEDYANVAMLGFATMEQKFIINGPVRGLMLVNVQTESKGFPEVDLYEDIGFALEHIYNGKYVTALLPGTINYGMLPGGGATFLYAKDGTMAESSKKLRTLYPINTSVTLMPPPYGGALVVNWKEFQASIRSRHVEALVNGE